MHAVLARKTGFFISKLIPGNCYTERSNSREMKLFSFPFFFLLAQTLQGIEGEVQCRNNDTVPSCFYCMFNPEANRPVDPENCNTSPDCMLDSSRCVPRPENPSTQNPVPPVNPSTPAITEASVNTQAPVLPQEVFLSRIKVNLKQPTQWSNEQFGFQVEVCNESFCCRSIDMLTQIWTGWAQPILFVSQLNNLGNCGVLTKYETLDVTVYKTTQGYHPDLMSVVITFEDGSLFREQEFSRSCNRLDRNCRPQPLRWNFPFLDMRENNPSGNRRSREEALPADQCPDVHKPYDHVCPKDNVKILRVKPQRERKICYYQR